jgi:two-component system nitrogen regulation sensor histidine kinase GlnL
MHYSAYSGLELLDSAVLVLDHAWRIVYLNPAAESLFELSQRLAAGLSLEQAFPNDGKALLQAATLARRNNTSFIEHDLKLLTASHNELHLSCNATPLESGNAALLIEFRPIDQQIKIANEERILVQQQANRELIRNLAHEIKNPLGGIRGAAQLLERELVRRELTEYTQVIIQEAERLQSLIDRLLTPHRIPQVSGREYSRSAGAGAQRAAGRNADRPENPPRLRYQPAAADRRQGAADSGDAEHRPQRGASDAGAGRNHPAYARCAASDAGAQAPPAGDARCRSSTTARVFPRPSATISFYPLVSGRADGTGLGLTLAQTYIHQHHGAIDFDSKPGHTSFNILLPLTQEN